MHKQRPDGSSGWRRGASCWQRLPLRWRLAACSPSHTGGHLHDVDGAAAGWGLVYVASDGLWCRMEVRWVLSAALLVRAPVALVACVGVTSELFIPTPPLDTAAAREGCPILPPSLPALHGAAVRRGVPPSDTTAYMTQSIMPQHANTLGITFGGQVEHGHWCQIAASCACRSLLGLHGFPRNSISTQPLHLLHTSHPCSPNCFDHLQPLCLPVLAVGQDSKCCCCSF